MLLSQKYYKLNKIKLEYYSIASDTYWHLQILILNVIQIGASTDPEYKQAHAFSIYLIQPFLATSLALLSYNW